MDLKPKKGAFPPSVRGYWLPAEAEPGGGWFQGQGRLGEGLTVYRFFDPSNAILGKMEVRDVHGEIWIYELYQQSTTKRRSRLTTHIDRSDNTTRYEYDSSSRITCVHRPDGVTENWNYQPSWIGGASGWNQTNYSGIEVSYTDRLTGQTIQKHTNYFLFLRQFGSPAPLLGDRLYRIYSPAGTYLPPLPGSPGTAVHDTAGAAQRHQVTQFEYDLPGPQIGRIKHCTSDGVLPSSEVSSLTLLRELTYVQAGGRMRVLTEHNLVTGQQFAFTYVEDLDTQSRRIDGITVVENGGTTTATELDDYQRPTKITITPANNATGRPRASDADAHGRVEPTSIERRITYSFCSACSGKPTLIEEIPAGSTTGRVWEYEYNLVGLLTKEKAPNPDGSSQPAVTEYSWSPLIAGDTYGTYKLDWEKTPEGRMWTYSYELADRYTPSGEVARGKKVKKQTRTSPSISGGAVPAVLTEFVERDFSNPTFDAQGRQNALIGFATREVDADGVETTFQRNAIGHLTTKTVNPNGLAADRLTTLYVPARNGVPTEITTNAHSALSRTTTFTYTDGEQLQSVVSTVGAQTIESKFFYDQWGNLAVMLERNGASHGGAPDDFGPSPRSDNARTWLRREFHYASSQLLATLEDRRQLDRNDTGPLVDDADARFLLTAYVWNDDGLLAQVASPKGSVTTYTYDGYKTLYKTELASPGQTSLVSRRFVNSYLETVRQTEGTGSLLSVTDLDRNAAGVVTRVIEPVGQSPAGYPNTWGVPSAIHEYVADVMGRTVEAKSFVSPGAPADLLVREVTTFDEIGRRRLSEVFEGSSTTPSEVVTTLWEGASKVKKFTGPAGRFVERFFDGLGRVVEERDSRDPTNPNKTITEFEPKTDFVKKVKALNWDEMPGVGAYVTREVEYVRDTLGRVLQAKHGPVGSPLVHTFTYYNNGSTESYTDPRGKVEKYLPDAVGRLVERFRPQGTSIWNGTTYLDWTGTNDRSEMLQVDGLGHLTRTVFDFAGRTEVVMEPGNVTEPTAAAPNQPFAQFHQYDALSRLTDIHSGDDAHVHFDRDGVGRVIGRSRVPVPGSSNPHVSWYYGGDWIARNALGQVIKSKSYFGIPGLGDYVNEEFEHDALGRTHRESYQYLFVTNWTDVESTYSTTALGDPVRRGLTYDNNAGGVDNLWIDHVPNAIGRLQSMAWRTTVGGTATPLASYFHEGDAIRRRTTSYPLGGSSPSSFTTDYSYDAYGRMTGIDHSFSAAASVAFHYDLSSNLLKEVYEKQGLSGTGEGDRFAYDDHNRLVKAYLGSDAANLAAADPDTVGTFVQRLTYGLDAANNREVVATLPGGGTETQEVYALQDAGDDQGPSNRYKDVDGTKLWHDDRGNLIFDGQHYYVYDALNRLTEVYAIAEQGQQMMAGGGGSAASSGAMTSQASAASAEGVEPAEPVAVAPAPSYLVEDISALRHARASIMSRVGAGLLTVLASNQQSPIAPQLREGLSPLAVQAVAPAAPGAGSASAGAIAAEGGGESSMSSSMAPSPEGLDLVLEAIYLYDSSERRVVRWLLADNLYYYAYDDWEEVQELALGYGAVKQFVWGEQLDELVAFRTKASNGSWNSYYVAEGGAHCPSRVLDSDGTVVEIQEYDPYGKTTFFRGTGGKLGDVSEVGNPFGWKGHRIDPETGLVYMRHRHYAPQGGRFLTVDPLGGWSDVYNNGNGYDYVGCLPTSAVDRSGLQTQHGELGLVGADGKVTPLGMSKNGQWSEVNRAWEKANPEAGPAPKREEFHLTDLPLRTWDMNANGWRELTDCEFADAREKTLRWRDEAARVLLALGVEAALLGAGLHAPIPATRGVPVRLPTGKSAGPAAKPPSGSAKAAGPRKLTFSEQKDLGHGERHVPKDADAAVRKAIGEDLAKKPMLKAGEPSQGTVVVDGTTYTYRAYGVSDTHTNVGTYVKGLMGRDISK